MIWRLSGLALAILIGGLLLYLSPFWVFDLWGREGLFGIEALRPGGDLLSSWLRGTWLAPYDILIWAIGVFLVLTWSERFLGLLRSKV